MAVVADRVGRGVLADTIEEDGFQGGHAAIETALGEVRIGGSDCAGAAGEDVTVRGLVDPRRAGINVEERLLSALQHIRS